MSSKAIRGFLSSLLIAQCLEKDLVGSYFKKIISFVASPFLTPQAAGSVNKLILFV